MEKRIDTVKDLMDILNKIENPEKIFVNIKVGEHEHFIDCIGQTIDWRGNKKNEILIIAD